eukprot:tig00001331_g8170.t1
MANWFYGDHPSFGTIEASGPIAASPPPPPQYVPTEKLTIPRHSGEALNMRLLLCRNPDYWQSHQQMCLQDEMIARRMLNLPDSYTQKALLPSQFHGIAEEDLSRVPLYKSLPYQIKLVANEEDAEQGEASEEDLGEIAAFDVPAAEGAPAPADESPLDDATFDAAEDELFC